MLEMIMVKITQTDWRQRQYHKLGQSMAIIIIFKYLVSEEQGRVYRQLNFHMVIFLQGRNDG